MKLIPLTQGYEAMVDDEDYLRVIQYKWYVRNSRGIYACRTLTSSKLEIFLHNFILHPPKGFTVDHEDRNGLNCQKYNLRFATRSQQIINRVTLHKKTNEYRGVFPNGKNWQTVLLHNKTRYYGGTYTNIVDAAKAYDELAKKYHGEFAMLNFPVEKNNV
jgi:hypothetical protein